MHESIRRAQIAAALIAIVAGAGCSKSTQFTPATTASLPSAAHAAQTATVQSGPAFTVFTAGSTPGFPATAAAWDITPGPGDAMWFTDTQTPAIGKITTAGTVSEYTGLPSGARPYSLASDPQGNVWFTDPGTASIGRLLPSGKVEEFTSPALAGTYPQGIAYGPDHKIWFVSLGLNSSISSVSQSGHIDVFPISPQLSPDGSLIADARGTLWFMAIENGYGVMVERRLNGVMVRHHTGLYQAMEPCCPNLAPKRMALGVHDDVWFTTLNYGSYKTLQNIVGTMQYDTARFYKLGNGSMQYSVYPSGIALGPDGNVWITGNDPFQLNGGLWSVNTSTGAATPYAVPYSPIGIANGGSGTVWFTSKFGGLPSQIVEVTLK